MGNHPQGNQTNHKKLTARFSSWDYQKKMSGESASITRTTDKGCYWSITINNPSNEEITLWENLAKHAPFVKEVKGQIERGEEGTRHIQGMLKTDRVRFSAVKKILPRAHIEIAKNALALEKYVMKAETREAPLKQSRREILVATPEVVQSALYDSFYNIVFDYDLIPQWEGMFKEKLVFKLKERATPLCTKSPVNFMKILKQEYLWATYMDMNKEKIMNDTYGFLIQRGYYNTEFMKENNLVNNAFKNNLLNIIIRHARQVQIREESKNNQEDNEREETHVS